MANPVSAQGPAFYDGKTIRIVVDLAAGGGFDTYARLVGRHLGKYNLFTLDPPILAKLKDILYR